ncbi:ABC transporter substrate-binding protein [Ilumatobacter sp.]|uniref:ABC transporter substrate-binding protein n=1 Tax=Ilumatobacter sp. TaxID=1967498 RepID=UPI003AF799B6
MTRRLAGSLLALVLVATACSDDGSETSENTSTGTETSVDSPPVPTTASTDSTDSTVDADDLAVIPGEAFPDARCEANRAAGSISYLTGFDFAATASIIDVIVANDRNYYSELCLDVDVAPSFSTANYPLVAANDAQFSSSGSFSELATFAATNEADLVALAVEGHVAIDGLMVKPEIESLEAIADTTIGVKGKLPPSIAAMLAEIGLVEGTDFDTLLLEGFDPLAHWEVEGVSSVPGWKSNEPGTLERAGVPFTLYDPADFGIPGSFGLIYTNRSFLEDHPTAAEDFMRATMRGLADAIADPAGAAATAVELINGGGNPNFLSPEGEMFRWETDARLITATTPAGSHPGVPDPAGLAAEIAAYDAVGVYGDDGAPPVDGRFDADLVAGLYDADGTVIWPDG